MPDPLAFNPAAKKIEVPPLPQEAAETPQAQLEQEEPQQQERQEPPGPAPVYVPLNKKSKGSNHWRSPQGISTIETKRRIGEGFFEYQARISPNDWDSNRLYGNYIYKLLPGGKRKRIGDEPIKRPITLAEVREIAASEGSGTYYIQLQTNLDHLSPCAETLTFDDEGKMTTSAASFGKNDPEGTAYTMKVASDITKDAARAAVEMMKENQTQNNKQPDLGGLLSGMATLITATQPKHEPREDKTPELLMAMLQNQAKDAERRAEAAERRAEEQRKADREEADRREQRARDEANAARERDKNFFELMLKQAETKSDSLNQMTTLITSFMKVKETIDDSIGGGPKGPWDLVAGVADTVLQQAPAIAAALKGAPPAQVAQMQQAAQNPQPQASQEPFYDMVIRLAKYFQRDPANYDGVYLVEMIENEYGVVHAEIFNQPKETVIAAVGAFEPWGKAIMDHPQASVFMAKIVDAIKFPDTMEDLFPDGEEEKEPEVILAEPGAVRTVRPRRLNGKAAGKHA